MKIHFSLGILFLFCAYGDLRAPFPISFNDADSKEEAVSFLNQKRLELAIKHNIANMHEISYDTELENEMLNAHCLQVRDPKFVVVKIESYEDLMNILDQLLNKSHERTKEFDDLRARRKVTQYLLEDSASFFHPVETKFGCYQKQDCDIFLMCAVGPKNEPSESDIKYGPPGSACPNGKTDSGLCKSRVQMEKSEVKEENGSNYSSLLIALLVIVFFM